MTHPFAQITSFVAQQGGPNIPTDSAKGWFETNTTSIGIIVFAAAMILVMIPGTGKAGDYAKYSLFGVFAIGMAIGGGMQWVFELGKGMFG